MLLLFLSTPLLQETQLEVFVSCRNPEIFSNYRNTNFKQEIGTAADGLNIKIKSRTLTLRNLNHVLRTDEAYVAGQDPVVREIFSQVRLNALSVADYLGNISTFLANRIEYSQADLPQGTASVLQQKKAHCIGFANVAQTLLACVGIVSRPVNGFFLRENDRQVEPVPHRWLEIELPGKAPRLLRPAVPGFFFTLPGHQPGSTPGQYRAFPGRHHQKKQKNPG